MKKGLVSIMLVLCCLSSLVGCGGDTSEPVESGNSHASSSMQPDSADVAYSGDLTFYAALSDKSVCEDKTIEAIGEYKDKFLSNYYIGEVSDDFYVAFSFKDKTDEVKELEYGDIITIRGKCFDTADGHLQLSNSVLLSVEKPGGSTTPTESTTMPAETLVLPKAATLTDALTPSENSTFSIHFIDVGQADAALVECDGHYMLIDGGNKADSNTIYSVLKTARVPKFDIVVGTHAHEDHVGGIPGAFNYTKADLTLCAAKRYDSDAFDDFKKYADKSGGGIVIPTVNDTYSLGSASVKILGVNGGSDTNDTSIVLMVTYGETKFLFAGDAEREAEQAILNSGADLSATVLKVGHHGSDTSTTYPFLREIMPGYAVISVGAGNSYGHPTEDTLSRLRDADVKVYRTDLQGDIKCTSDGKTVSFSVTKNANADTLAPATKTEPTPTPPLAPTPDPEPDGPYYILNTSSKKFHDPDCGSASKISASNKDYYTGAAEDLVAKGYEPCDNCKPYEMPEPEPEPTPTSSPSETTVWIPKSGSKYHSHSGCSNMKGPSKVTKSQAIARGYTACSRCW